MGIRIPVVYRKRAFGGVFMVRSMRGSLHLPMIFGHSDDVKQDQE